MMLKVELHFRFNSMPIECFNRYEPLAQLDYSNEAVSSSSNSANQNGSVYVDVNLVGSKAEVGRKQMGKEIESSYMEFFGVV